VAEGPLAGRTALVTGAGSPSGIGFATARLLGERVFLFKITSTTERIHERRPPILLATEGHTKTCPLCGDSYTVLHGREFFADESVIGRPFIVNSNGVFVREDIARGRNLRTPRGAFEPGIVAFQPLS